jgi:hypothetical protein
MSSMFLVPEEGIEERENPVVFLYLELKLSVD